MKKKKSVQDIIKIFVLSFKISYNASKPVMILRLIIMFVSAFIPLINTYSIKNITDSLIYQRLEQVIIWFAVLAVTQISSAVIGKIITYLSNIHDDKITHQTTLSIIDKINDLDISYFDDSKFYDELSNVTRDINDIPKFVWTVFSTIQILIKFVSSFIILLSFNAYSPFIICLSCIPNFILDKKYSLKFYSWNRKSANDIRRINYTYDVLTSKYFSKDLRINSLYKSMREKYILQWNNWLNKKKELLFRQFLFTFVTMFLPHITTLFFSYQLIVSIVKGVNSVGDFSYFISLMGQVTTGTLNFISSVSNILENMMKIELFNDFNTWKTRLPKSGERIAKDFKSLEFIDVSFKFPGTEKYILKHVSFKINKGEKIAIVGKNGAGKSTLIKLILRLYTPDSGLIKLNGFNVDEYEYKSYYKIFSVMLQDYINYSFSLSDNIKFSDIHSHHSKKRMLQACLEGDAYDFVKYWKHGLNSYLTKAFDSDGVELSTGQWQKIALSRFFYRKAYVYIMDEPSASLDIESEFSIFKNAFRKCKNKTLILISHKLQNINMMNKIIVLNNGKICEKGTHQELMINKGIYYNLYSLQKSKYVL